MANKVLGNSQLKVLVFGAGAMGTYVGGSLALTGHRVVFVERPEVAEGMLKRGMRLRIDDVEHRIPKPIIAPSLKEALAQGPFDVALFALKSFDTQSALEGISPFAAEMPPILCLQNGVDNEAAMAEVLGEDKVIAGTVTSAIRRRDAGDVVLERLRGIGIADGHPLSKRLEAEMFKANIHPRLYPIAADMKWSKMLTNLLGNASSAILNMTPADIFAHFGLYRLEIAQLREMMAVMAAQGIGATNLPGTPVRALALGVRLPLSLSRPLLARAVGGGRGGKMPSFHIDLHSGRGKSEVGFLNGAVVRAGERLGIPTPVNRLFNDTLLSLTNGDEPLDTYAGKPAKLLERID